MSSPAKKLQSTELKLVEVHGQKLTTTTEIISESCKISHGAVIKLVRKFKDDMNEVGRVRFEIRPFETKGGVQEREIALLDDYSAMLLLTHMRSNEIVSKFKKTLVQEFKRLKRIINEPGRNTELQAKRNTALEMTDSIKFIRETFGKESTQRHYTNEHLFCNRALTGAWKPITESDLDVYDTRLLAAIRRRNTLLMTRHPAQADRKQLLDDFVNGYRTKHPRLMLVTGGVS